MANTISGNIVSATIADLKTAMVWLQTNYPTNLRLHATGNDLSVTFGFSVADLDAGIIAVNAILTEYPTATWNAELE